MPCRFGMERIRLIENVETIPRGATGWVISQRGQDYRVQFDPPHPRFDPDGFDWLIYQHEAEPI